MIKQSKIIPLVLLFVSFFSVHSHCQNILEINSKRQVDETLNLFHKAAAKADAQTYFSLFTKSAIFIGTDPKETWTLQEFKAFAEPYFNEGKGWSYVPRNRHIYFSENLQSAWFDEMLDHSKYGETRGTGVLVKTKRGWKIAQYHLTLPIPNAITADVVKLIQLRNNEK